MDLAEHRRLARELQALGHNVSSHLVADLLHATGYSLQLNQKTEEGTAHPDRDAQFRYLNAAVVRHQRRHQPVISVDTKKKELVGDFKNGGRAWRPKGQPERVRVHDFLIPERGKAIPYGVYDLHRNEGWVSVGIDHDTATFAVRAIRRWWQHMGRPAYPRATSLLITADCRRQQRRSAAALEVGTPAARRSHGPDHHGVSFPARDEQVEQDRAPAVLAHRHELARHTARRPGDHRESDRGHHLDVRPAGRARNSTAGGTRRVSRSPTRRWRSFSWNLTSSTGTGTTPSNPTGLG